MSNVPGTIQDLINTRKVYPAALRKGIIKKLTSCEDCGYVPPEPRFLHGHHEDYSKPLEVVWLCVRCHGNRHSSLPKKSTPWSEILIARASLKPPVPLPSIKLSCPRAECGHQWPYKGTSKFIASCPKCKTTVLIHKKIPEAP